jgi:hypothetical protein
MLGESAQIALKLVQLADARLDLLAMALNQLQDVSARGCPGVADSDDVADFRDRQANRLGRADECQT